MAEPQCPCTGLELLTASSECLLVHVVCGRAAPNDARDIRAHSCALALLGRPNHACRHYNIGGAATCATDI